MKETYWRLMDVERNGIKLHVYLKKLRYDLYFKHDISYRIYRNWEDFEEYNIQNIRKIKMLKL